MFGLFKRKTILDWEVELLIRVIEKLPREYSVLINQINDGLFKGVILNASDINGYVAFTLNSVVLKKYDKDNERDYKLTNIKVYDRKSSKFLFYEIYISGGTISGYSLISNKEFEIDVSQVNVKEFRKEFIGESDFRRIANIFNQDERMLINQSHVYSVIVNDKEYFHIKDAEDGDFIGIDLEKNVYKITHDPMEIKPIKKTLLEILKSQHVF